MKPKVYVYDPTANDELSRVRGIGRYLQILKENFSSDWTFTNNIAIEQYSHSIFINPFFNFLKPPLLMTRLAKKQVAVIHDLIPLKYADHFPAGLRGRLNIFLNKLALKNYDLIITDSEASKKDIVQILDQPEKIIKVIYPCLPKIFMRDRKWKKVIETSQEDRSRKIEINPISKFQLPNPFPSPSSNFCIYVGDATWNKNLVNLAKAIKIINVPCIFVGKVFNDFEKAKTPVLRQSPGGPPARSVGVRRSKNTVSSFFNKNPSQSPPQNNPWQQELNEFNQLTIDDKRFIFAGYIPDDQLIELYKKAKLNILVSRDEGYGFSYFEAASQGCPSILSNIQVLQETAGNTSLFADPNNPQDIADKINELFSNEVLRNQLGQKAKSRLKYFSPKSFKKAFISFL